MRQSSYYTTDRTRFSTTFRIFSASSALPRFVIAFQLSNSTVELHTVHWRSQGALGTIVSSRVQIAEHQKPNSVWRNGNETTFVVTRRVFWAVIVQNAFTVGESRCGRLRRSLDPLAGGERARCPFPKNPSSLSAFGPRLPFPRQIPVHAYASPKSITYVSP